MQEVMDLLTLEPDDHELRSRMAAGVPAGCAEKGMDGRCGLFMFSLYFDCTSTSDTRTTAAVRVNTTPSRALCAPV